MFLFYNLSLLRAANIRKLLWSLNLYSTVMNDALLLSGREIVYSVCEWGYQFPWHWGGSKLIQLHFILKFPVMPF